MSPATLFKKVLTVHGVGRTLEGDEALDVMRKGRMKKIRRRGRGGTGVVRREPLRVAAYGDITEEVCATFRACGLP